MAPPEAELEQHRPALTGHCYRMLGSVVDADDAVQETMIRAWRGREGFDGRAALRTWLYRIATNVCLDSLEKRGRRERPIDLSSAGTIDDLLESRPRGHWLEPIPDHRALAADDDPEAQVVLRESIRLAFVAALQVLPPKQRAALLLTEVLGWSAAEVAAALSTSVAAVNSALQRARATLAERKERPTQVPSPELLRRYVSAFERYDTEALAQLLTEDAVMSMPPYTLWLQGVAPIQAWLEGRGSGCRGSRLVPVEACGGPAFAQYRNGGAQAWALVVLESDGQRLSRMTYFLDTEVLFPRFGLPQVFA